MKYADMHCDSITACFLKGGDMRSFAGQINTQKLKRANCLLQCFAIFTNGKNAAEDFKRFLAFYNDFISCGEVVPVHSYSDIVQAEKLGKTAAVLTVENLGFLNGDCGKIASLAGAGVKMASLVWNDENAFAYPNLVKNGEEVDLFQRDARPLKRAGEEAVELLESQKIIIDISHLSDGGADFILSRARQSVVASHSNCKEVCPVSRNLTDGQIKKIADCGGVVGLNFCYDFIGGDDPLDGLYRHLVHLINKGGEEVAALGSDFDGIPPYSPLADCTAVDKLLNYFSSRGIPQRAIEKVAYKNFLRVFKQVCG